MFQNYIKIALRNIVRFKAYAFINLSGLAVGMAACLFILLYVQNELSYDKYHEKADRIFRVSRAWYNADGEISLHLGKVAPPFAPLLKSDFEGIILNAVRFLNDDPLLIRDDTKIEEEKFFFVDADVFEVFSWNLIEGDPKTALAEPNSIVITRSAAKRFFGDENPMNQMLNYEGQMEMKITGIMEDVPETSHFTVDYLCSFSTVENYYGKDELMQNFGSNNYSTYLLLPPGYDYHQLQNQMGTFLNNHLQEYNGIKPEQYNKLTLWPITSIHLYSHLDSEADANGDIAYIYIFSAVALLTLIIACINFMNLATARSARRAKEVGMRKVMGAFRLSIFQQFMVESILFAFFSFIIAYVIVYISLPWFNNFVQKALSLSLVDNQFLIILFLGITLFVGFLSGSYPAIFLSSFKPIKILGGLKSTKRQGISLRSILVIAQFSISIILIISVGIIQDQLNYVRSKPLGFNKDNLLSLPINDEIYNQYEILRERFINHPGINAVTISSIVPSGRLLDSQGTTAEVDGEMKPISFRIADVHVDHNFLNSFEIPMQAGRNFDINLASDSTESFILNESAIKAIGWASNDEAINKRFQYGGRTGQVIGVVKDFHFESLHQEIAPIVFLITNGRSRSMIFRLNSTQKEEILSYLEEQWSYLMPGYPFSYYWVNDRYSEQYSNEDKLSTLISYFSALAVFIAALGLYGLAAFTSEQRFKEIGVRKVMGASIQQLLVLLTRGFTILVVISFAIAVPVAWYIMGKWLDTFSYQTVFHVSSFLFAGLAAIFIAWLTVGYQCIKAASINPVDALKYDE